MIIAEPLTPDAFAPFGDVIEAGLGTTFDINDGFTTRCHALAQADCAGPVIMSIFQGRVRPLEIAMLERHPLGTQAFVPLGGRPWLALVAADPTIEACRLFLCKGSQGVQYARNIWHHPLLVLDAAQDFLVVDNGGDAPNLEEVFFERSVALSL